MPVKVSFLVDGFNMYHSLKTLQGASGASVKWLDLQKLCQTYLQAVRNAIGERVDLAAIHWFSARPNHLASHSPDTLKRYDAYAAALTATGVDVNLSQFKRKDTTCPRCKKTFTRYEEKETDVAIAVRLLECLVSECGTAVLISGDTDLIPAIRVANRLMPRCKVGVGFPFMRHNNELESAANYSFKIGQKDIQRAQLPAEIRTGAGELIRKPSAW
jgi:hypothetical protein